MVELVKTDAGSWNEIILSTFLSSVGKPAEASKGKSPAHQPVNIRFTGVSAMIWDAMSRRVKFGDKIREKEISKLMSGLVCPRPFASTLAVS